MGVDTFVERELNIAFLNIKDFYVYDNHGLNFIKDSHMKKRRTVRLVLLTLLLVIVVLQFIPVDRSVPEVDPSKDFLAKYEAPTAVAMTLKEACYDCHSHKTKYPWYSYVAPVSMWLQGHVDEGKEHLNFSEWTDYDRDRELHKLEEMAEEVEEGHMPLNSYTWTHAEGRLSTEQRTALVTWVNTLRQ